MSALRKTNICREENYYDSLLEEHISLIRYHADQLHRRTPSSIERDDLINAGVVGLLESAERFDEKKEVQFKTFVSYRIRGAMIDYLRAFDWFPRKLRESSKAIQSVMQTLEKEHGRPASDEEIANELGVSIDDYHTKLSHVRTMSVMYFEDLPGINGGDSESMSFIDMIPADQACNPERQASLNQFIGQLADSVENLPTKERIMLTLYYFEDLSMKEIALVFDITESRVSQIHSQMVLRLRQSLGLNIPESPVAH